MSIAIARVHFSYEEKRVLEDINLTIESGETVGIVGVSGGGKSTLLKLISGLYDVCRGEIAVMGARASQERRANVAMVMQSAALFPASVRDNITCGRPIDELAIGRACEAAQLSEWIDSLPDGLNTFVGERGGKVSGGQAQRIAIARAIAKDAPVLLLDEPTSALDEETSASLLGALHDFMRGRTVLNVSHRPESLHGCGRVLRLEGGRLYGAS